MHFTFYTFDVGVGTNYVKNYMCKLMSCQFVNAEIDFEVYV